MLYELREYEAVPGKMPALNERFANHAIGLFKKHDIEVVGFWTEDVGSSNKLVYILSFQDSAHREKAWSSFYADAEWNSVREESERRAGGPLVARIQNRILKPTAYSPMK